MKWISYIFSALWRLWFLIIFSCVFLCFIPLLFFFTAIIENRKVVCHLTRYWSKLTLCLSFIFPKIEWEQNLNKEDYYIFCPNHVSTLDIPFILAVLPFPLQFMGKAEITKIPVFGYFYKKNSVIVDRKKKKESYIAFLEAGERLNDGINMCIFPEGGIPKSDVILKKFKNGAFKLAIEKNIKIVPITMPDNKKMFPKLYFKGSPGIARIKIHNPIDPKKIIEKSVENLNASVYNVIFEQLKKYESN